VIIVGLPFFAGTRAYPVAIVDGDSMNPTLHSGDLVFYTAARGPIANGTIIVFVQSDTGVSALEMFLRPTIIHRVVGVGKEPTGMTYYKTKGDNNAYPDGFVTDSVNVLGVPRVIVPYVGSPILFLQTPFGMVAAVSALCLYFLSSIDTQVAEDKEKQRLIAVFAKESLNGTISAKQFERLKLAVEYYREVPTEQVQDPTMLSILDWLKAGGIDHKWREEDVRCPKCNRPAFRVVSGEKFFLLCPACNGWRPEPSGG